MPIPSVTITILSNQTVGQPLVLECDVSTVRGITSRVDIVWSSNGEELNVIRGVSTSLETNDSLLFTDTYIIPQLSTADENREYLCEIMVDTEPPVRATGSVILNVTGKHANVFRYTCSYIIKQCLLVFAIYLSGIVPDIQISVSPSDPIQGAMVGSPQDIQCIVSTVSGVELSSVMISWMGPGGESITNDSRVTISSTTSSGNNYTSSLQFTYLMEGDEGTYTCNVMILETIATNAINIAALTGEYLQS